MSGVEASTVLGIISSIITVVDKTKTIYDAAKDAKGLPEAFREVAKRLPIAHNILAAAQERIEDEDVNVESCEGVEPVVKACKKKAKRLEEVFRKALPGADASVIEQYYKAVRILGKENKVETLMRGILEDIQLLTGYQIMFRVTADQEKQLARAISDVSALESSIPDTMPQQETQFSNIHNGDGPQYNCHGKQFVTVDSGRQWIAESMTFGKESD